MSFSSPNHIKLREREEREREREREKCWSHSRIYMPLPMISYLSHTHTYRALETRDKALQTPSCSVSSPLA